MIRKRWRKGEKLLAIALALLLIAGTLPIGLFSVRATGIAEEGPAEPTPTPTPTPTPEPQETSTPAPTATPSAEPPSEETPAPEATAEGTPEATGAPEETPEPEATDAPEETPEPKPTDAQTSEPAPGPEETPEAEATPEPEETPDPNLEDQSPDAVESKGKLVMRPKNRYSGWYGVVPSDERGMGIPILYQFDYPAAVCTINGIPRSVATSGCGATSVSMVIAYLTENVEQNPYTLFYHAVEMGRYHGSGLDHETLSWLLRENGVQSRWIRNDAQDVVEALNEGKPVIAHMGPGIFTSGGHYIVLRGVTEDGKILVNDPASEKKTHSAFPIETLMTQARTYDSFLVCWVDAPDEEAEEIEEGGAFAVTGAAMAAEVFAWGEDPIAEDVPLAPKRGKDPVAQDVPVASTPRPTFEIAVDATLEPGA